MRIMLIIFEICLILVPARANKQGLDKDQLHAHKLTTLYENQIMIRCSNRTQRTRIDFCRSSRKCHIEATLGRLSHISVNNACVSEPELEEDSFQIELSNSECLIKEKDNQLILRTDLFSLRKSFNCSTENIMSTDSLELYKDGKRLQTVDSINLHDALIIKAKHDFQRCFLYLVENNMKLIFIHEGKVVSQTEKYVELQKLSDNQHVVRISQLAYLFDTRKTANITKTPVVFECEVLDEEGLATRKQLVIVKFNSTLEIYKENRKLENGDSVNLQDGLTIKGGQGLQECYFYLEQNSTMKMVFIKKGKVVAGLKDFIQINENQDGENDTQINRVDRLINVKNLGNLMKVAIVFECQFVVNKQLVSKRKMLVISVEMKASRSDTLGNWIMAGISFLVVAVIIGVVYCAWKGKKMVKERKTAAIEANMMEMEPLTSSTLTAASGTSRIRTIFLSVVRTSSLSGCLLRSVLAVVAREVLPDGQERNLNLMDDEPLDLTLEYRIINEPRYEIRSDQVEILSSMAEGHFGRVSLGKFKAISENEEPILVAVKSLKRACTWVQLKSLIMEMEIYLFMDSFQNQGYRDHCTRMLGATTSSIKDFKLFVEFCDQGDLLSFIRRSQLGYLSTSSETGQKEHVLQLSRWAIVDSLLQMSRALIFLHSNGVVHRDVACRNFLVQTISDLICLRPQSKTRKYLVKLADFGLSRPVSPQDNYYILQLYGNASPCLPFRWCAPEVADTGKVGKEADIWSLAVAFWEVLSGGLMPYSSFVSPQDILEALRNGIRLQKPPGCEPEICQLMQDCWQIEKAVRPDIIEIEARLTQILTNMNEVTGTKSSSYSNLDL